MITTVTLNPAFDKAITVKNLTMGESNPVLSIRFDPGGKGINVSRVAKELGRDTLALGFIAGATGEFIETHLEKRGIKTNFLCVSGATRTNITLIDTERPPATELNAPGPRIKESDLAGMEKIILEALKESNLVVFAGSLPENCPPDVYKRLILLVESKGARAVLDSRDEALREGLKAKPYLIKPNRHEAAALLGRDLKTLDDVAQAAKDLMNDKTRVVVISLGGDGALMATGDGVFKADPVKVEVRSGVGAGDSMVAGICIGIAENMPWEEALRLGSACGAATAMRDGTELCKRRDVERLVDLVPVRKL